MQKRGTWLRAGLTGAAAGAVNGLFGAGGGMLLLPLLHRLTDLREHEAFACSVCTMLPLSVVSLVVYWLRGGEFLTAALPYLAGGALGEGAFGGDILESYPALFGGVERITVLPDEFDDRCALYLRVLGDLWGKDTGLNGGAEIVSVDLSKAPGGLTAGEKAAVAYVFAQKHGVQGLTMTFDELREEGYLTGEKLEGGSTAYSFTNGLLFTITPEETQDNGASVCFSAGKWRSPLGAYFFTECTASRGESGWEYSVGAEMIS